MITPLSLALALTAILAQGSRAITADDLAAAKVLYASGAYEEALTRLSTANGEMTEVNAGVGQVRALCLLALGRSDEARRSLEELVNRRPLYKMSDAEVSPQVIAMFHDIRKRLLPTAVKDLYTSAKANFDRKRYGLSTPQFRDLLAMINDEDMAEQSVAFADMKTLGEGFLRLSEELETLAAKPAPTASPTPAAGSVPEPGRVYTDEHPEVKPPVELARPMPMWHPPNPVAERTEHRGVLRVVIDEQGRVESAAFIKSVAPSYDPLVLASATTQWRYKPATLNGQPVKFQKLIQIVLSAR